MHNIHIGVGVSRAKLAMLLKLGSARLRIQCHATADYTSKFMCCRSASLPHWTVLSVPSRSPCWRRRRSMPRVARGPALSLPEPCSPKGRAGVLPRVFLGHFARCAMLVFARERCARCASGYCADGCICGMSCAASSIFSAVLRRSREWLSRVPGGGCLEGLPYPSVRSAARHGLLERATRHRRAWPPRPRATSSRWWRGGTWPCRPGSSLHRSAMPCTRHEPEA
jgi:hypothetical protein